MPKIYILKISCVLHNPKHFQVMYNVFLDHILVALFAAHWESSDISNLSLTHVYDKLCSRPVAYYASIYPRTVKRLINRDRARSAQLTSIVIVAT